MADTGIIFKSTITDQHRKILLDHPKIKFLTKNYNIHFPTYTFIYPDKTKTHFDKTVLNFLSSINIDYSDKIVEYWFQSHDEGSELQPHCDHNCILINDYLRRGIVNGKWLHSLPKEICTSPLTLVTYLEISDDMLGGELLISQRSWVDEEDPLNKSVDYLSNYPFETVNPVQNDVIAFKGSWYYHWIAPIKRGRRKSMIINFWPAELTNLQYFNEYNKQDYDYSFNT